jgi:4-amino-4-deoxy-L-arabinose transferase-like glycosyltransferase
MLAALFALAFAARLAFVIWAPGVPEGDGYFYHHYASFMRQGYGYMNMDGSPGIIWMPGWPAFLSALYAAFGLDPKVGMIGNAVLGAATTLLLAALGTRWFSARIGALAALLYALWPALVFYAATLYSETLFSFLLVASLALFARGADSVERRPVWFAAGGLGLGLCAMVKAEPLILVPLILLFLWVARRSTGDFLRSAAAVCLTTAVVMTPWIVRNHRVFERLIVTSGGGGHIAWLGNHEGARGGNDLRAAMAYNNSFPAGLNAAETTLLQNEQGWRDVWQFVRAHPGEELRILLRKLQLTYLSDAESAELVRGFGPPADRNLSLATYVRLRGVANAYWFALMPLAALGLLRVRRARREAQVLLFGLVGAWLGIHLVFLGGPRFRVPEAPVYALFAACGIDLVAGALLRRIRPAVDAVP